jgi:hypothetical protein
MRGSTPQEWLRVWAERYPEDYLEDIYRDLIARYESLSSEDFEKIGKWKDNAWRESVWKANVARVAYQIWMKAAEELPVFPDGSEPETFLYNWVNRTYTDEYKNGPKVKHFGLSRSSTLLHFVSGGRFPIFDSRVRSAVSRLLGIPVPPDTITYYLKTYCPLFLEIAALCETADLRKLDKALFSYGALDKSAFAD